MKVHTFIAIAVSLLSFDANASCRYPEPDGSDIKPSAPNLHGTIALLKQDRIVIKSNSAKSVVEISRPKDGIIYSAFGGDVSVSDLRVGQTVWVWYKDCKTPLTGKPVPAYFQVYSKDPTEKP